MKRDVILTKPITSSFLSCEKDTEIILRKLFVESRPYSDILKSLLIIQQQDCIENLSYYKTELDKFNLAKLIEKEYIILSPKLHLEEHAPLQSYLSISFDEFLPNANNPAFRDCNIHFDIMCHHDTWDLTDYQQRPFKILGYIDGILNSSKLTGIGIVQFVSCKLNVINENWSYHTLTYHVIHGSDDQLPLEEENEE